MLLRVTLVQNIGATGGQMLFSTASVLELVLFYWTNHELIQRVQVVSILLPSGAVVMTNLLSHSQRHTYSALQRIHMVFAFSYARSGHTSLA